MSSRLTDNVSSQYFDAANHLRPKWKKMKVITYVESYDDIFFWRNILAAYETEQLGFEVVLPSRTNLSRGKKSAIMNNLGNHLGTSMIACVDADYDYLMQSENDFSHSMLSNPFVVHTYVYAIENYHCYAPSLHEVCTAATLNDHRMFDFETYLTLYSQIIYDIFIWHIWLHRKQRAGDFPMTAFNNLVSAKKLNIHSPLTCLEELRRAVNRKMAYLQHHYPEAKGKLQSLKEELGTLGLTPDNTYLYIQGHNLVENVVMPAVSQVCTSLRKFREREIQSCAMHPQQMANELAGYQHCIIPADEALKRNQNFKTAPQFLQLQRRLEELVPTLVPQE